LSSAEEKNQKDITKPSPPLLTKMAIPKARQRQVKRERLLNILNQGYENGRRLTLISAPAGYGKSVLAAEWVRNLQARGDHSAKVFWLSLEERDNNPGRFFSYLASIYNNLAFNTPKIPFSPNYTIG
jgi:LuxR family transcriptional regulator, maltose regulon positive regulatory protein